MMGKILLLIFAAVMFASYCNAACYENVGSCPVGRKSGDTWIENCQNCSCSGQIQEPTTLCYLPSDKPSYPVNLHVVNYDSTKVEAEVQQTGCPRGFVEVNAADMYNIKAELILAFAPKPTGGRFGCCDISLYPTDVHKSCKAVKIGCHWKIVRKNNENLPCPHPVFFSGK